MGNQDFFPEMGADSFPGQTTPIEQQVRIFQRDGGKFERVEGVVVDAASVDAGNTGNTTKLRPGLVLLKTVGGKYVPADHGSAPVVGAVTLVGILHHWLDMRDKSLTAVDKPAAVLIAGFVTDSQIIYVDGSYKATVQAALKLVDFR